MEFAPGLFYTDKLEIWVLFDIRDDSAILGFHRLRACLQENSDVEALDADHYLLRIRPGGAQRRAA